MCLRMFEVWLSEKPSAHRYSSKSIGYILTTDSYPMDDTRLRPSEYDSSVKRDGSEDAPTPSLLSM